MERQVLNFRERLLLTISNSSNLLIESNKGMFLARQLGEESLEHGDSVSIKIVERSLI